MLPSISNNYVGSFQLISLSIGILIGYSRFNKEIHISEIRTISILLRNILIPILRFISISTNINMSNIRFIIYGFFWQYLIIKICKHLSCKLIKEISGDKNLVTLISLQNIGNWSLMLLQVIFSNQHYTNYELNEAKSYASCWAFSWIIVNSLEFNRAKGYTHLSKDSYLLSCNSIKACTLGFIFGMNNFLYYNFISIHGPSKGIIINILSTISSATPGIILLLPSMHIGILFKDIYQDFNKIQTIKKIALMTIYIYMIKILNSVLVFFCYYFLWIIQDYIPTFIRNIVIYDNYILFTFTLLQSFAPPTQTAILTYLQNNTDKKECITIGCSAILNYVLLSIIATTVVKVLSSFIIVK